MRWEMGRRMSQSLMGGESAASIMALQTGFAIPSS